MINLAKFKYHGLNRFESDVVLDSDKSTAADLARLAEFESDVVLDSDKSYDTFYTAFGRFESDAVSDRDKLEHWCQSCIY